MSIHLVRTQVGGGGVGQKRTQYYEFISNSDVILRTKGGGGGQKRPKFCVRTKWMLPNSDVILRTGGGRGSEKGEILHTY